MIRLVVPKKPATRIINELKNTGFEVVGVSVDTSSKHVKFIEKYDLPFL